MYSFRAIHNAVMAADPPQGFPYGARLTPERISDINAAPHFQDLLTEIRTAAHKAHHEPIPPLPFSLWKLYETQGTRMEYERPYFARRGRLLSLTLATLLDQTDEHLDALHDTIWAICDEYSWCLPAHLGRGAGPERAGRVPPEQMVDLFAAETAHALAETLTMLGDRLSPWINYRVRAEIERRVFRPLFYDPAHFHWESLPMNWSAVCAGASGMAALLLERDRERLAGMVERCARAMECFLEGFGDDGGCAEGVSYWQYGFGYYTYFAAMLHDYTGGQLDLLQGDKIARIAAFPAAVSLGGDNFVNYSDGAAHMELATGLVSLLHARTGSDVPPLKRVPSFHADHCYRWPHVTRNLLWTDPALLGGTVPTGTTMLDDLQWIVDRRLIDGDIVAFSAKGGHNDEPHNQNDLGHFILHVGGESLLADLGAGMYTREYFGPQRYEQIHNSSLGHSVPVINGQPQGAGRDFHATVLEHEVQHDQLVFALDLTEAYDVATLRHFTRRFQWRSPTDDAAQLEITDSFAFSEQPTSLEEGFISLHRPDMNSGSVTWRGEHGAATLHYDAEQFSAAVEMIDSKDHDGQPITIYCTRLQAKQPQQEEQFTLTFDLAMHTKADAHA